MSEKLSKNGEYKKNKDIKHIKKSILKNHDNIEEDQNKNNEEKQ
jgi:hypothetical protein